MARPSFFQLRHMTKRTRSVAAPGKFPIPQREEDDTKHEHRNFKVVRHKRPQRRRLERHLEKDCIRLAKRTCKKMKLPKPQILKLNTFGHNSWPDRHFFMPRGVSLMVEFKKPEENPTPLQAKLHRRLRKLGHEVYVCKTVEEFARLLKKAGFRP